MKAYLLSDGEFLSKRHAELDELVTGFLAGRGFDVQKKTIERGELAFCRGCFDCWTKTPGECIMKDGVSEINRACMESDAVVYLCPVVFGQFSANIKSSIDRWLPNMLPFFMTRSDGSTMHPPRYEDYPAQVFLGYGEGLTDDEAELFVDISKKHRSSVEALVDRGDDEAVCAALMRMNLNRVGGPL
ncbi:MAG: flavodoxin family protein [Clostridiales bacterium]|nr:flavodoxin family protein [Clostridiales bacterium]